MENKQQILWNCCWNMCDQREKSQRC